MGQEEIRNREKIWTKSFIGIVITQLLFFTVFYTLLTTLPIYVIVNLGESESKAGLVVTFMLLSAIIVRPFSSKIIDRLGKKRVLIFSIILFMLTTVAYLIAFEFVTLAIIRFIHGVSFGFLTTVTGAIAADIVPAARRGEGMGYFAMSMNLAVVIGPFMGLLLLQHISFASLFIVLSSLMAISLIFALIVNTREQDLPEEFVKTSLSIHDLIDMKALPVTVISGMVGISYGSILSFVPVYAEELNLAKVASYFFLVFAIVMIVFRPYLGRAFDEKGPRIVLVPSLFVFALGLGLLSVTNTATVFLLAAAIIGLGYGTILPGFQTIAVERAGPKRTSQAMSTFFTMYDLGIGTGAFLWGLISSHYSFEIMYMISALLVVFTAILFNHYVTRQK